MKGTVTVIGPDALIGELLELAQLLEGHGIAPIIQTFPAAGGLPEPLLPPRSDEKCWTRQGYNRNLGTVQFVRLLDKGYTLFSAAYQMSARYDTTSRVTPPSRFFRIRVVVGNALIGLKYVRRGEFRREPLWDFDYSSVYAFGVLPLTRLRERLGEMIGNNTMMSTLEHLVQDVDLGFEEVPDENELTARLAWDGVCPG